MSSLPAEWPDYLPGYDWDPCFFEPTLQRHPFIQPPDLIIVHSGWKRPNVAKYMRNPRAATPAGWEGKKPKVWTVDTSSGVIYCPDGVWRRRVATHFNWDADREAYTQGLRLSCEGWGSGGARFLGKGRTNGRAIHIEAPGPAAADPRPPEHRTHLRALLVALTSAAPRGAEAPWLLTGHQWIDPGKHDPGPGVTSPWFEGLPVRVYWRDCRAG